MIYPLHKDIVLAPVKHGSPIQYALDVPKMLDFAGEYIQNRRIPILSLIYHKNKRGLPMGQFSEVTPLHPNQLEKLVKIKFITIAISYGEKYILKDVYWDALLEYLKACGKEVNKINYVKLKHCKTK